MILTWVKPNQKSRKIIPGKIYMLKTHTSKTTCVKYTWAVVLTMITNNKL